MTDRSASISPPSLAPQKPAASPSAAAHQVAARGPDSADATAPGGAERPQPARVRGRDHVRRIFSRADRDQCARRCLAGFSLGYDGPTNDQQRHGRRRLVRRRARARRGTPRHAPTISSSTHFSWRSLSVRSSPPYSCSAHPSCSDGWADGTRCWRTRSPTRM
jgi:hypothetical protein